MLCAIYVFVIFSVIALLGAVPRPTSPTSVTPDKDDTLMAHCLMLSAILNLGSKSKINTFFLPLSPQTEASN